MCFHSKRSCLDDCPSRPHCQASLPNPRAKLASMSNHARQTARSSRDNFWASCQEALRYSFRSFHPLVSSGSIRRGSTGPGPNPRCASRPCSQTESQVKSTTKGPSRLQPKSLSQSSPQARRIRVAIGANGSSHDLQLACCRRKRYRERLAGPFIEQGDLGIATQSLRAHRQTPFFARPKRLIG